MNSSHSQNILCISSLNGTNCKYKDKFTVSGIWYFAVLFENNKNKLFNKENEMFRDKFIH